MRLNGMPPGAGIVANKAAKGGEAVARFLAGVGSRLAAFSVVQRHRRAQPARGLVLVQNWQVLWGSLCSNGAGAVMRCSCQPKG